MIPFTQYHRPNGRKTQVEIERPQEIDDKAQKIIKAGFVFECEVLTTEMVSLTIADPISSVDAAISIAPNNRNLVFGLDDMITVFDIEESLLKRAQEQENV